MEFYSILYESAEDNITQETDKEPAFFTDLNLDQVINAITFGRDEYNLKPFFYSYQNPVKTILYRQAIMQDLEGEQLFQTIRLFAKGMSTARERLTLMEKSFYPLQKQYWFLSAVDVYCNTIQDFARHLSLTSIKSKGFILLRDYLTAYIASEHFQTLLQETQQIKEGLSSIKYSLIIKGSTVTVCKYEDEPDYSSEVFETFEKFRQGAVKDYTVEILEGRVMNHVEAKILEFVSLLFPDVFQPLEHYCQTYRTFLDGKVAIFDREIQFYIAYLDYMNIIRRDGLTFCYPLINNESKAVHNQEGFNIALAYKLVTNKQPVVCNSFYLAAQERIMVVSGPNQGGKTTFARTFGQLHYIARIGCPVPGQSAQLFLFDQLFTHFEKEEDIKNLRGKLHDDLARIYDILMKATPNSIIIMNEIFSSTTLQDAIFLSKQIMEKITHLDLLGVLVTFIDELTTFSEKIVSVVGEIIPDDYLQRTYKFSRKPADGLSYAVSVAEKYHLTYVELKERIPYESISHVSRS